MKANYLLPHRLKRIGWILLIPGTVLGVMVVFWNFQFSFLDLKVFSLCPTEFKMSNMPPARLMGIIGNNITDELAALLFITGGVFAAFSKEKDEDEYIAKIRLDSLLWATYVNYGIILFGFLFFYEFIFITVMAINLFTLLIVFLFRFNILLYKTKHRVYEE
jgi:hypothetical protein